MQSNDGEFSGVMKDVKNWADNIFGDWGYKYHKSQYEVYGWELIYRKKSKTLYLYAGYDGSGIFIEDKEDGKKGKKQPLIGKMSDAGADITRVRDAVKADKKRFNWKKMKVDERLLAEMELFGAYIKEFGGMVL